MPKSRFFRVAVEGATTDGRTIDSKWLQEMAETYNPQTYAARVNMEHIRGITAEPPFQSLGDVLSLKTEKIDLDIGGKTEKRLALFAEIEALEPLVAMNQKRQKLYTSVEISPNFANTGKAYLVGLAVTDSPASLGTEMLEFCQQQGDKSPLAARKQDPANLFSAGLETKIELADAAPNADPTGLFASIKALVEKLTAGPEAPKLELATPPAVKTDEKPAGDGAAAFAALGTAVGQIAGAVEQLTKSHSDAMAAMRTDLDGVKATLEKLPETGFRQRPAATGGENAARTDC